MGQSEGGWFHNLSSSTDDQSVCVRTVEYLAHRLQETLAVKHKRFRLENIFFHARLNMEHFAMLEYLLGLKHFNKFTFSCLIPC